MKKWAEMDISNRAWGYHCGVKDGLMSIINTIIPNSRIYTSQYKFNWQICLTSD